MQGAELRLVEPLGLLGLLLRHLRQGAALQEQDLRLRRQVSDVMPRGREGKRAMRSRTVFVMERVGWMDRVLRHLRYRYTIKGPGVYHRLTGHQEQTHPGLPWGAGGAGEVPERTMQRLELVGILGHVFYHVRQRDQNTRENVQGHPEHQTWFADISVWSWTNSRQRCMQLFPLYNNTTSNTGAIY